MANVLLCIEVHKDKLLAVRLAAGPYVNLVIGSADIKTKMRPLDKVVARLKEEVEHEDERVHLLFAPECLLFRNLTVPFSDRKKIEQILPMELVDSCPVEVEEMLIDFVITESGEEGAKIVAGLLPRDLLKNTLAALSDAGITPESIGVGGLPTCFNIIDNVAKDFVWLDIQAQSIGFFIINRARVSLVRSVSFDASTGGVDRVIQEVQRTLLASGNSRCLEGDTSIFVSGLPSLRDETIAGLKDEFENIDPQIYSQSDQPFIKINAVIRDKYFPGVMDGLLARTLRGADEKENFNFYKGEFRKKTSGKEFRQNFIKIALPIAAALVALIGFQIYDYSQLKDRQSSLDQKIVAVFKETLPSVTRVVNPLQQLKVANNEIRAAYGSGPDKGGDAQSMINLLAEISALIPESYQVRLTRMVADLETIRLRGMTADFNTVDNIQKELEKSDYFAEVDINSANQSPQNDEVRFELKLLLSR